MRKFNEKAISIHDKLFELSTEYFNIEKIKNSTKEDTNLSIEDYRSAAIKNAASLYLELFAAKDEIAIRVDVHVIGWEKTNIEQLEEELYGFYKQFLKGNGSQLNIETFIVNSDDEEDISLSEYNEKEIIASAEPTETVTRCLITGNSNNIEVIGLIVGKCNQLVGYECTEKQSFYIEDTIDIINLTKGLIYIPHNDTCIELYYNDLDTEKKLTPFR